MQLAFAAAILTAAVLAGPVSAQDASATSAAPMLGMVGYGLPAIGPGACKTVNSGYAECVIPAKTAGRYLAVASGTSTAKGEGATQTLAVGGKTWLCAKVVNSAKWSSGPRTFRIACMIEVLTDSPLTISVAYQDTNADKDPKGPTLTLQRTPWDGILSSKYLGGQ